MVEPLSSTSPAGVLERSLPPWMDPGTSLFSSAFVDEMKVQGPAGGEAKAAFTADAWKYILLNVCLLWKMNEFSDSKQREYKKKNMEYDKKESQMNSPTI